MRHPTTPPSQGQADLDTEVAVIGAGPYGLSLSAHLSASGVPHRIFGEPMDTWRHHMPKGMYLKSEGFASNLSDPGGESTLERFCGEQGLEYGRQAVPIGLDTFTRYGCWFQERLVPGLDVRLVRLVNPVSSGFELTLAGGERLHARRVVVATGVQGHAYTPPALNSLPPEALVHTYDEVDLEKIPAGGSVVVGAGQSALEVAALIQEHGGDVRVVARAPELAWLSRPGGRDRPLRERLRYPESGLGEGRAQWAYANYPLAFHAAPSEWRLRKAFSVLGPASAWWLRPRIERRVEILLERQLVGADVDHGMVCLRLQCAAGAEELTAGRVVAGTGYRPDLSGLSFLDPSVRANVASVAGAPVLDRSFQSSVPGLHFIGYLATPSFGPVMRFVYGADFTARRLAARFA